MSGYLGQECCLGSNPKEMQFLLDRKTGVEKKFSSREAAIEYLRKKEHYATDDLRFIFWFEDGEDKAREILTGNLVAPEPEDYLITDEDFINDEELRGG